MSIEERGRQIAAEITEATQRKITDELGLSGSIPVPLQAAIDAVGQAIAREFPRE